MHISIPMSHPRNHKWMFPFHPLIIINPALKVPIYEITKRGRVFPIVIWPAFRMGQYRLLYSVNDYAYHAPQFSPLPLKD